jgi:hypothetical protein
LFFLFLGCSYGVSVLFFPFYEPLRAQVKEHGLRWLYSNGTGLLDLPPPTALLRMLVSREPIPAKIVIDIVYPLLLGVGAVMAAFLGSHLKLITKAYTSLEYRVVLQQSCIDFFHHQQTSSGAGAAKKSKRRNPFDQGWRGNIRQVLGHPLWWIFLPIRVTAPPPYFPPKKGL